MFYVYIIESELDNTFYIGQTNDVGKRIEYHNQGLSRYTSRKTPWKLVYVENYQTRKEAILREKFLKRQKNRDFYKKLIG